MRKYLAIDIGASSGRHIVGWKEGGELKTEEVYRFPNGAKEENGHLIWDLSALLRSVKAGIAAAFAAHPGIGSLAIDTWAVDYVLFEEGRELSPCYAYRDGRTERTVPLVHEKIPFEELYRRTGIQFQPFNTVYQLYDDLLSGRLRRASGFWMLPEYLSYRLAGKSAHEYTNATTTGLLNGAGEYDGEIVSRLGLPGHLFGKVSPPGTVLGDLLPEVAEEVGGNCKIILCATHDTASAVEGIPMEEGEAYLSSGTWSLLGAKTDRIHADGQSMRANFSNEGGVGYIRYQKNVMGQWVVNRLREELCPGEDFSRIAEAARRSAYSRTVDVNESRFFAPMSMKQAFDEALGGSPAAKADYFCCAFRSLARCYGEAVRELKSNLGRRFRKLYIVGGGAKNEFLNELTAEACGLETVALPIEATALGNLKLQMESTI